MKEIKWKVEPIYDEIITVSESTFAAKNNGKYFVRNYEGTILYQFDDENIKDIRSINRREELSQDLIVVEKSNRKNQLFNISTLEFLNKIAYDVVQTEQYELRGNLIRINENRCEGLVDFQGNIIIPPKYKQLFVDNSSIVAFVDDEIFVYDRKGTSICTYHFKGLGYINHKKYLQCAKLVKGDSNIYEEVKVKRNGTHFVEYQQIEGYSIFTGIIDLNGNEIIPFEYSSIFIQTNSNYITVTKNEKVTKKAHKIEYFKPKIGLIDFDNTIVLPLEYKSIWVVNEAFAVVANFDSRSAIFDLRTREFATDFLPTSLDAQFEVEKLDKSNDFFRFKNDGKVGLKNRKNEILIPANYAHVHKTKYPNIFSVQNWSEGGLDLYGFYDIELGKEVVPVEYIDRSGLRVWDDRSQQDYFIVYDTEFKVGFYKLDGTLIVAPRFEDTLVEGFNENLAPVPDDNSEYFGVIDFDGNQIYDFIFDSFSLPYGKKSIVGYKGKFGVVDLT